MKNKFDNTCRELATLWKTDRPEFLISVFFMLVAITMVCLFAFLIGYVIVQAPLASLIIFICLLFVGILCSLAIARGNKLTNAERSQIPPAFVNTNNVPVVRQDVLRRALEAYRQETGRDPLDLPLEEYSEYIRNYIRDNTLPMLTVADAARDYDDYDEDDEEAPRPSDIDRDW